MLFVISTNCCLKPALASYWRHSVSDNHTFANRNSTLVQHTSKHAAVLTAQLGSLGVPGLGTSPQLSS